MKANFFSCPLLALALSLCAAPAQESLRYSLAGADAARARRNADASAGYYNLKLGPALCRFDAGLGIEANDNVRLQSSEPRQDLIFHPEVGAHMRWRMSDVNTLALNVGGGYSAYVQHPEFNRLFLTPGSELSFDMYAGDFWLNFHDRFSISANTYQDPTVVGSGDFSQLVNSLGQTTTWDLNKVVLRLGYDHVNYVWLQGADTPGLQPSGQSEVFSSSAGYTLCAGTSIGVELGGSLVHYSQSEPTQPYSDATEWSVGAFCETQISEYLRGRVSAGYMVYTPDAPACLAAALAFRGLYAQGGLEHRLNRFVTYTLTAGRTINFAFYGGTVDLEFVRWQADWNLVRKLNLATSFEYQHGSQLLLAPETFDRYGPGASLMRHLTQHLAAILAYQCYFRTSDLPGRNYTVNILALNLNYRF